MKSSTAQRKRFCLEDGCQLQSSVKGYCRKHYIARWHDLKNEKNQRAERRLDDFVNRLAEKYPKDYLKKLKEGLESEDKFAQAIQDLDVEPEPKESTETEREFLERFERKIKGE